MSDSLPSVTRFGPSAITIAFAEDADKLIKFGVILEKGGTMAQGAGIGAGAVAAFQHHPVVGVVAVLAGGIINVVAQEQKQKKISEMREKWTALFNRMDQSELRLFVAEIHKYYPTILPALHSSLLGTSATALLMQ